jgi:hypothetical protein
MNAPDTTLLRGAEWSAANQRWLAGRFAALRERIEASLPDAAAEPGAPREQSEARDGAQEAPREFIAAAEHVAALFGLSPFELELLLLAAGVEIDDALRRAVASAQGTAADQPMGIDYALALKLLPRAHWDAISPLAPLRRWQLLLADMSGGLAHASLRIDERVLHHIAGVAATEPRLDGLAQWLPAEADAPVDPLAAERAAQALRHGAAPLLVLTGSETATRDLAVQAAAHAGLVLLWAEPAHWPQEARDFADGTRRLDREAALLGACIAMPLDAAGDGPEAAASLAQARRLVGALGSPVLLLAAHAPAQHWPGRRVTRIEARPPAPALPAAAEPAAAQFQVDARTLEATRAALADSDDAGAWWAALREAARGGLDALAQRIDSRAGFEDLVLPPATLATLRDIAGQLRHRRRVFEDWGFGARESRGQGLCALFTGESGTGKTLAAEAIANELALDLYRIDLALVVSKYIGETEKNLRRVFDAAEASGAVLLFDEADALFGKRSDVKDSHDRYANIEVAYLLQRVESYRGLAILTTNLRSALDRAFLRRLRFVVPFPFPDEAAREAIWRRQFPPQAPLGAVDFEALARIHLPGGHIRAIAVNAAFAAARRDTPIEQPLLMEAARAELAKLERSFAHARVGGAG